MLKSVGQYQEAPVSDCQEEIIRIIDESYVFREYSDINGMPKRVSYERVKDFYREYNCKVGWKYYMRLFPVMDELLINTIRSNASK